MEIYNLIKDYVRFAGIAPAIDEAHPELGHSLSLFHSCLLESGLPFAEDELGRRITASPAEISLQHLSRFVVAHLPFNAVTGKSETNEVLFDLYSFLRWLEKRDIRHGLEQVDFQNRVQELTQAQERCLQLSHFLDDETEKTLEEPPQIVQTVNDIFSVIKIDKGFIHVKGKHQDDPVRLRLPPGVLEMVRMNDHLDLVLGDTSEKWVILEAGQVFPESKPGRGISSL